MAIHKGPVREQFTQIPNATHRDTSISLQARGLLGYLLSLPDDWIVRPKQLAEDNGIARNTAYKIINELKESGYIIQVQDRSVSGKFGSGDYLVFRSKEDALWYAETRVDTEPEPCTKKRDAVKRDTVKRELTKKEEKNKEINNNNTTEPEKISLSEFREKLVASLHGSPVNKAIIWDRAEEFHTRYKQPSATMVAEIIYNDWKAVNKL